MTPPQGLLKDRAILVGMLLFCGFESVTSWLNLTRYLRFPHDPVHVFGLAFATFITASIAYRSPLFADRVLFGSRNRRLSTNGGADCASASLSMLAVETAEALMWTVAATVSVAALVRASVLRRSG